mgnify:CR=1 FL=1
MQGTIVNIADIIQTGQQVGAVRHYRLEAAEEPDIFTVITIETVERIQGRKRWPLGKIGAQQGDVYFARLAQVPQRAQRVLVNDGQLVPGHTQGSRHCVNPTEVRLWGLPQATALQGPIIEAPGAFTVTHPEHGHLTFPGGVYAVTYQREYAQELRRIAD